MTGDTTLPPADACEHEYTLNVQLTHAWCQKCDLVIPMVASDSIQRLIAERAVAAERARIRDGSSTITGRNDQAFYLVPADLLDDAT